MGGGGVGEEFGDIMFDQCDRGFVWFRFLLQRPLVLAQSDRKTVRFFNPLCFWSVLQILELRMR